MAELMFGLGQTKKKKDTEKKILANKKAQQHYEGRPDEDVEAVQRKEHHSRDQGMKETSKGTLKGNANVNISETVESNVRADQHNRSKDETRKIVQTKTDLRDVNITDTVESEARKEQHTREQDWKQTGKQTKGDNTSFDMAKALFN
jgi:hypothetical protein